MNPEPMTSMPRRGVFLLALLLSLLAHGAAAWYWSARNASEGAGEQGYARAPLQLAVSMPRAPETPPETPPAPLPETQAVETPQPEVNEPPLTQRPTARTTPVAAQPAPPPAPVAPLSEPPPQTVATASAGRGAAQAAPAIDYAGLTESYRSRVMARIESFKHYPLAARRQRVEGSLEVDLNIGCDGAVASLNVEGAYGVLRSAAARSVKRAAPLPAPPPQLDCPHRLQYAMSYRLR